MANLANFVTLIRVFLTPVFIVVMAQSVTHPDLRWVAAAIFGFAAATDWFDGQIARRTRTVSEIGKTLDPLADRFFIGATLITLYAMRMLPLLFLVVVLGRDIVMAAGYPIIGKIDKSKIAVHWTGKVATATLFVALGCLIVVPPPHMGSYVGFTGYVWTDFTSWQTWGLWLFAIGMCWSLVSAGVYFSRVLELLREEREKEGPGEAAEQGSTA